MRTCRLRVETSICQECFDMAEACGIDIVCTECSAYNKRFELLHVGVGTGLFGEDWAIVVADGAPMKVSLGSVYDIKEE